MFLEKNIQILEMFTGRRDTIKKLDNIRLIAANDITSQV